MPLGEAARDAEVPGPVPARSRKLVTIIAIIAINALPVAGVLLLGWKVFHIALLYWFEVFIIGVAEVVGRLVFSPEPEAARKIRDDIAASTSGVMQAALWIRLVFIEISSRIIGTLVTAIIFSIMAAMYGLAIVQFLSAQRLPPPPEAIVEHTAIAVPAAILIYIFTTNLKWPAILILIRFAAGGILRFFDWWRSGRAAPEQPSSSSFLMHILFLHLASFAVVILINLLGSPEPAVLAILIGKAAVELFIAHYDLTDT